MEGNARLNDNELLLDTKGSCFLCLKESPAMAVGGKLKKEMSKANFRRICGYLDIRPDLNISSNCRELSVMLCANCFSLSETLIDLILQLEKMQMLVHQQLKQFHRNLITCEEEEETFSKECRWRNFQNKLEMFSTRDEVALVNKFRQDAKERSFGKLQQLTKEDQVPEGNMKNKEQEEESVLLSVSTGPAPEENEKSKEDETNNGQDEDDNNVSPIVSQILSKLYDEVRCKVKNTSQFRCNLCKGKCRNLQSKNSIERHLANVHPGNIFSSVRLPVVPEPAFVNYCRDVLKGESIVENQNYDFLCSYCSYKHHERQHLRGHLVLEHWEILGEKIAQYQDEIETILQRDMQSDPIPVNNQDSEEKEMVDLPKRVPIRRQLYSSGEASTSNLNDNQEKLPKRIRVRTKLYTPGDALTSNYTPPVKRKRKAKTFNYIPDELFDTDYIPQGSRSSYRIVNAAPQLTPPPPVTHVEYRRKKRSSNWSKPPECESDGDGSFEIVTEDAEKTVKMESELVGDLEMKLGSGEMIIITEEQPQPLLKDPLQEEEGTENGVKSVHVKKERKEDSMMIYEEGPVVVKTENVLENSIDIAPEPVIKTEMESILPDF